MEVISGSILTLLYSETCVEVTPDYNRECVPTSAGISLAHMMMNWRKSHLIQSNEILLRAIPFKNVGKGGGGAEINSKCAYRGGGGVMIIQNALIGGFSFNRNALGGGGPTRSGVFRMWGGGGVHINLILSPK